MNSPLLLDQLAAVRRVEMLTDACWRRAVRRAADASGREGLLRRAASGVRRLAQPQGQQVCCA